MLFFIVLLCLSPVLLSIAAGGIIYLRIMKGEEITVRSYPVWIGVAGLLFALVGIIPLLS